MLKTTMPGLDFGPDTKVEGGLASPSSAGLSTVKKTGEGVTTLAKEIVALRKNQELLKAEMAEHREYLLHLMADTKKIRRYILMNTIGELLKLALIFVPLIFAYFALKPYLSQVTEGFSKMQQTFSDIGGFSNLLK